MFLKVLHQTNEREARSTQTLRSVEGGGVINGVNIPLNLLVATRNNDFDNNDVQND